MINAPRIIEHRVETCDSTQLLARTEIAAVRQGERPTIVVVRADRQTNGHGRMQRSWQQPSGAALLVSIAMRPNREVAKLEQLPRAVAATLIEASPSPEIQWRSPNDLVSDADGAKVGGILIDVRTSAGVVEGLVIGVGVNVTGGAFHTLDGRAASTIEAVCGVDAHTARACAEAMYANLTSLAMELVSP